MFLASAFLSFAHPSTAIPIAARNASMVLTVGEFVCVLVCAVLPFVWKETSWNRVERFAMVARSLASAIALPTMLFLRLLYPFSV